MSSGIFLPTFQRLLLHHHGCQYLPDYMVGATSQKIAIFIFSAIQNTNLTSILIFIFMSLLAKVVPVPKHNVTHMYYQGTEHEAPHYLKMYLLLMCWA
jgi:hypothetical protein